MSVFFSGTDMSELQDNIHNHNYYLSLIVNNFMDFCCKIAIKGTVDFQQEASYSSADEQGVAYPVFTSNITLKKEKMFVYDCEVISSVEGIDVPETFMGKIKSLIEKAVKVAPSKNTSDSWKERVDKYEKESSYSNKDKPYSRNSGFGAADKFSKELNTNQGPLSGQLDFFSGQQQKYSSRVEAFTAALLRFGDTRVGSVENALDDLKASKMSKSTIGINIVNNYNSIYDLFFSEDNQDDKDLIKFTKNLQGVIDCLSEWTGYYPFVYNILDALKSFGNKITHKLNQHV